MRIRTPIVGDAAAIARVHVAAWQAGYVGILPADYLSGLSDTLPGRVERWERSIARSADSVLLVEIAPSELPDSASGNMPVSSDGLTLVGICSFGTPRDDGAGEDTGELYMINLAPQAWGTGVGAALFAAATARLAEQYRHAYLWVLRDNARARRFYAKQGWSFDGGAKVDRRGEVELNEVRYSVTFDS